LNVNQNKQQNNEFEKYEQEFDDIFEQHFNKPSLLINTKPNHKNDIKSPISQFDSE